MESLLDHLKRTGRIQYVAPTKIAKARSMFVNRGLNVHHIAQALGEKPAIIQRWVVTFDWEEERERKIFDQFRKLSKFRKSSKSLDERHDRIAGSIESILESMLNDYHNGKVELSPKDLRQLVAILKDTQTIRRTAAGLTTESKENRVKISLDTPESIKAAQEAIVDLVGGPSRLKVEEKKVDLLPAQDVEYEVVERKHEGF